MAIRDVFVKLVLPHDYDFVNGLKAVNVNVCNTKGNNCHFT